MDTIKQAEMILENMPIASVIFKINRGHSLEETRAEYVYANEKYKERFGKGSTDFIGKDYMEFWGNITQPRWIRDAVKVLNTQKTVYTYAYSTSTKTCWDTTIIPFGLEDYCVCTIKELVSKPKEYNALIDSLMRECSSLYKIDWESDDISAFLISDKKDQIMSKHWESYENFRTAAIAYVEQNVCKNDSENVLEQLLNIREILDKKEFHNIIYEKKLKKDIEYEQMFLSVIKENGENVGFSLSVKDITEKYLESIKKGKQLDEYNRQEQQLVKALSSTAISFYDFNITKDYMINSPVLKNRTKIRDLLFDNNLPKHCAFSSFIRKWRENVIEEDLDKYDEFFSLNNFMDCYRKGILEKTIYYGLKIDNNDKCFVKQSVLLSKNKKTKDIVAFTYIMDSTDEIRMKNELQKSLILSQQSNRNKQKIIDNMLQELRTYMNSIIGYVAISYGNVQDKINVDMYLEKILEESKGFLEKIDSGFKDNTVDDNVRFAKSKESINEIVAELRKMLDTFIVAEHIDFLIDVCEVKNDMVYCDKIRLTQILLQIITNMINFTAENNVVFLRVSQSKCKKLECSKKGCAIYEFEVRGKGEKLVKKYESDFESLRRNIENIGAEAKIEICEDEIVIIGMSICLKMVNE